MGLIENLGQITHLMLLSISYPGNMEVYGETVYPLISFNMFDFNDLFFNLDEIEDTDAISEQFKTVGYDSKLAIKLLGDLLYFQVFFPVLLVIVVILRYLAKYLPCS